MPQSRSRSQTLTRADLRKGGAILALGLLTAGIAGQMARSESHQVEETTNEAGETVLKAHGYNFYGELEYPEDYTHFNYVNPDAPKGGEFAIDASGTFDSMNPYSRKGRAGALSSMMYEQLLDGGAPADEYAASYCLLCESLEYDPGVNWVIFHLRPEAKFSDGTPLTAEDVVFSHNLFLEQGLPSYAQAVKQRVTGAEVIDAHTVKFTFAPDISRRSLISQVGAVDVFSKKWFEETGARLDEPRMETSPGSGPYMIDSYDVNRRITYKRNPDYWGKDLPVNVGRHNYDTIRVEYFADETAAFEAFKAGVYTFRAETNSKQWATGYEFPAVQNGWVTKEEIPDGNPPTNVGFVFNLGKEKLQDKRVREALALGYNFEWSNESLQYGLFSQRQSFFQDTVQQAQDVPSGAELELLKSLGDLVPEEMLTEPVRMPHTSSATRVVDRKNLRTAMGLLDEAGWAVGSDGMRRNEAGETLDIVIPINSSGSPTMESLVGTYVQNLQQMGVNAKVEKVDPSQYTLRSRERDYDMIFDGYRTFLGAGTGLMQLYGSEQAAISVFNPAGIASPLIDKLIDTALFAETKEEETLALTALDRALRYEFFIVPAYYKADNWLAYYDMYRHPENMPAFATGEMDFWWVDEARAEELKAAGALR
ncbi:extracellular solute-binding protein [Pseudooceanicola sp. C21-150M6]|uniref:extracellular solute-binding protein n=1 Tax=Pseudooceanicola sp. C21-150M6 TaxID=3434355 RepID=UPI003D7FFECF